MTTVGDVIAAATGDPYVNLIWAVRLFLVVVGLGMLVALAATRLPGVWI